MSERKARRERGPVPLSGAGLVRFFEEEIKGIKVPPIAVVGLSLGLTISVLVAHLLLR